MDICRKITFIDIFFSESLSLLMLPNTQQEVKFSFHFSTIEKEAYLGRDLDLWFATFSCDTYCLIMTLEIVSLLK